MDEADDGGSLYLFWRYIAWRRARGLPDVDLDAPGAIALIVAELDELLVGVVITQIEQP
jgi:hypothetical protein